MGSAGTFIEEFLLARQFADLLAVVTRDQPEAGLRGWLEDAPITVLAPTDTGLALCAAELGWRGPDKPLHFLIARTAARLGLDPRQAMLRLAQAHLSPGNHLLPGPGQEDRLLTLDGTALRLAAHSVLAPGGPCSLMISDQICDNGVVHVIARPILPFAPDPVARPAPPPAAPPHLIIDTTADAFRFQF